MVSAEREDLQLTVGSEVEVTSDEDGFSAWYEATILEPIPKSSAKKKKKILVQYKNLVTDDGSELLKEYVDPVHVRPLPPPDPNPSFEVNDAIDAFYQDGWWPGVILKALGGSNFMIFHDSPLDIIETDSSNLRKHMEWVHGKWVPSKKQKPTSGSIFSPGTAVEVNIQKDNSRGAWCPATFIKEIDKNIFLVKHLSSKDDMGDVFPDELLSPKLPVDSQHIRPTPPLYVKRSYELLEKVEAFYGFAWRAGLITKVLGEGRYLVFFKHANKDKEFSQSEVRPPVEWIDGKWVSNSKEVLIASDCQENLGHDSNNGDVQEVKSSGSAIDQVEKKKKSVKNPRKHSMELSTPSTESSLFNDVTPSTKKLKLAASKANATDLQPSEKLESKLSEPPLSVTPCKVRKSVGKTPSREAGSATVGTGSRSIKQSFSGDQLSAKTNRPWKMQYKIRQMKLGEPDNQSNDTGRKLEKPSVKYPRASAAGQKETAVTIGMDVSTGLESPAVEGPDNENHRPLPDDILPGSTPLRSPKKLLTDPSDNKSTSVEGSSKKRKRGRPRRLVISPRGSENNGVGGIDDDMAEKECCTVFKDSLDAAKQEAGEVAETNCSIKEVEVASAGTTGSVVDDDQPLSTWIIGSCKQVDKSDKKVNESSKQVKESGKEANESSKQVDELDKEVNESSKQVDELDKEVNESSKQVDELDKEVIGSSKQVDEWDKEVNESSKQFDELGKEVNESSKQVDELDKEVNGSSKQVDELDKEVNESSKQADKSQKEANESSLFSGGAVNQRDETTDAPVDSPAVNTSSNSVDGENERLPFVKSSPIWKTIESMEVFHMMPQKPHFRPLAECKEEYREGSAIGNMITFANLVEKTSKLQFDDPRSAFDSILETLLHLEEHGFEVKPVEARVQELISIKSSEEEHQDELKDLDSKILQREDERNQYADEMDKIMEKIRELQEKHATIKSKHDIVDTEVARLQKQFEIIHESTQNAHTDFKKVAAAPWKSA